MKRKCFIIMPFSGTETVPEKEDWNKIYEDFFTPAWNEVDFECERTSIKRGSITKDIIEKCFDADIVMADLTDTNPNVMYELGLRHTFKKPSMMVKQKGCDIPFDVKDYMVHQYENTSTGLKCFKELVKGVVEDLELHPEKPDNPVWDMIHFGGFMIDYYNRKEMKNKLKALVTELQGNSNLVQAIIELYDEKKLKVDVLRLMLLNIKTDCITLLITTRYINFSEDDWEKIIDLYSKSNIYLRIVTPLSPGGYSQVTDEGYSIFNEYEERINIVIIIIEKRLDEIATVK